MRPVALCPPVIFMQKGFLSMARFCPLFSGSKGNATYIGASGEGVLIDVGVSGKALTAMLAQRTIDIAHISAIFVTHEHIDHVSGLHAVAAKYHLPVYASEKTLQTLDEMGKLKNLEVHSIADSVTLGGLTVSRFSTPHDCAGSSGYCIDLPDGSRVAVATDIGHLTDEIRTALLGCDLVMLESNHDVMMLQNGPYPYPLKRRILGDNGHLSNACCAEFLPTLVRSGTTRLVLAHLSRENNYPSLALESARAALMAEGLHENEDYLLTVAPEAGGGLITL